MFLLKWPCFRAEWSELSCKTQQFETVDEKYISSDVSIILLTDEKIFTAVTSRNPKNHQLYATAATKKKDKTLAHTINVQTVTDGISWRVTSGREITSLILVDNGVKVIEGCYRHVSK